MFDTLFEILEKKYPLEQSCSSWAKDSYLKCLIEIVIIHTYAGPLPDKDPMALIIDSGTCLQTPDASKILLTSSISWGVALLPGQNAVHPSPTIMGVFGITLIIRAQSSNGLSTYQLY